MQIVSAQLLNKMKISSFLDWQLTNFLLRNTIILYREGLEDESEAFYQNKTIEARNGN